jgi:hypothetical protein
MIGIVCFLFAPQTSNALSNARQIDTTVLRISSQPVDASSIAPGASHVPMLRLRFQAPCSHRVQIISIEVQMIGLGDVRDIEGLYITEDHLRLSRRIAPSTADRRVHLRPRHLTIPSCSSRTIDIAADFVLNATVGGEFALRIVSSQNIKTDGELPTGNFPLSTNGTVTLEVTPRSAGDVVATFLDHPDYIPLADNALAKFYLEATDAPYQCLQMITLTNDGTAKNDEMRDLYIARIGDTQLTNVVPALDRDRVVLDFLEPYCLEEGKTQLFTLRGRAWTRKETNAFALEEPSDIYAVPMWRLPRDQ